MRRIKDEEERKRLLQRGQELSEQYEKNRQAVQQAEAQTIKNSKVHWVDPTATGVKGVANRIGWIARNAKASADKSLLDTTSAFGQSTIVGLQRGANQSAQEQTTWDKIKNYGKNVLKSYAYTSPDMVSKLLYMSTIGRQDAINENNQVANQIAQNYEKAQTGFGKFGAIAGGVTSKVVQDNNSLVQGIYAGGQQLGQALGEDKAKQTIENITKTDTKLHEKNDKKLEELRREGTLYDGVTRKLGETGQTVGYMTPSIAIGLVTGGAGEAVGLAQMGLASKGSTTREAMQQGADLETAERKGVASGTAEVASEKMFGGLKAFKPFKESGVEDVAKKYIAETIEKRISSQLGQTVAKTAGNWLVDVTGETIEELTTDIYDTWLDQATTDPNAQYTLDDAINTAVGTALSTTVLNVGYTGLNKGIQKVYDRNQARANNQESIPEAERTESNGYKENLQEMINNLDVPDEVRAQIEPMINSDASINAEEYKEITDSIKTFVKANTQQQIDSLSNDLNNQYIDINNRLSELDNIKAENFKDPESRRFYAQQMNKEFGDTTLDSILAGYPENRNGNRTVKQYKEIAKAYGKQMAENGLTFDEVRANTVGAWQYYEPNKNITRYDNQQKKNASFDRLNSQVWSQIVYDSYKDNMRTQLQQQQEALSTQMNDELTRLQDKENITLMTIDDLKPKASPEQVARTKKLIEDFAKARGVNVEYNAEVFKNNNEEGFIKDKGNGERTIYINPNADTDTILVKLATHEMFHDTIRTQPHDKLTQLVMDKLKADENYDMYRQSVVDAYLDELNKLENTNKEALTIDELTDKQNALVDEEMTAKYLGEYLGDEQFVQQLVNSTNRSTIQKIMDWIDNRLQQIKNVVTGNKEAEYWRKVRENFEKAYNSKYQGQEGVQFSKELENQINQLTDDGKMTMTYVRMKNQNTQNYGDTYGQNIEPAGEYMSMDILQGQNKVPGAEYGTIHFEKPLILEHKSTDANGWKKDLSERYNGLTGKKLSEAIKSDGYDAIMTQDSDGNYIEVVNLNGEKINNNQTNIRDNQGRTLTKEQQEYFKDSKVRDENGNLLEVYHSTPEFGFTIFDKEKLSRSPRLSQWGKGFYFTDNEIASADYKLSETGWSDNSGTYKTYLNITNPLILNNSVKQTHTLDRVKLTQLLLEGNNDYFFDSWIPFEIAQKELNNDKTFTKEQLQKMSREEKVDKYLQYNFDKGYTGDQNILSEMLRAYKTNTDLIDNFSKIFNVDGIIVKGGRANQYIAFNSNQIKNVDNLNPTDNPDIRYSKKTAFDEALQQDNQGRELSEEQKEYFKDSKVRDRDGNLITLYHGTDNEVTTFDTNKPTYARYGSGAYLTDGIGIASDFADIRAESNNGKARIIEGYANIDKMFDNTTGLTENTPERQKLFELLKERGLSDRQLSNIESAEIDYPFQLMERYLVKDEVTNDPWIKANTVNELLREAGYNGIKGYYGDGSYEYVTFNSNQIKDIENKKPTTNDDIRYSKKTAFDEALQEQNYRDSHQIDTQDSETLSNLNLTDIEQKVKKVNGALSKQDQTDLSRLKKILNNPDNITIYRASPVNELNNGDWVTTDKSYAQNVAKENGGKVYSYQVSANDLLYPNNVRDLPSLHRLSSFQYNKNNQTNVTDNQGNTINPGMQEYLKDVSSEELVDGKVPLVYHTTTDETSQFNIFNPVGTPYYRFGDQVVNYYTDSKDMSGSYASSKYKMADTKKLNNIEEAKQYLYDYGRTTGNLVKISQNENGNYVLSQEKQTNNEAREFVNSLSEDEMQQMRDNIFYDKDMEGTPYEYAFSWDKFDKSLQEKFKNVTDKYTGTADLVDLENEIMKYVQQPGLMLNNDSIDGEIIKEYKDENELLRNIKEDIGKTNWSKNTRIQYQGYVKLTNPYVVDAEERNWNQVVSQSNDFIDELTETVSEDTINNLSRLYKESQEISADAREEYDKYDRVTRDIDSPEVDLLSGYPEYGKDNDIKSMNHLLRRTSLNDILLLDNGDTNLGVSFWYSLADVLQQDGIIGEATAKNIIDDFKLPEQVKDWVHKELYKEVNFKLEDVHNLKELYEKKNEAYQKFDKYRYENSYFKEKIMADENEEGYVDLGELNNLLEQRAEVRGADVVADEIAQASSVGFSKPELIRLWGTSKTTNDIVKEVIASNQDGTTNYDGVIIKNVYDYGGKSENETKPANVYVTFNSNQFKAQDNMNPTEDADIRYSKKTKFDKALQKDNQGRTLSEGQQKYFEDSKVKDDNGNLLTLYHGTNSDFNVFDITKGGQSNTGASIGFWFTESKEGAENFANEVPYGDNKGIAKEVYLNIENPKVYDKVQVTQEQLDSYKTKIKELEDEATSLRKQYSWDRTDYKTTMTFESYMRDFMSGDVNLDSMRGLGEERGLSTELIDRLLEDTKKYVELKQEAKNVENEYDRLRFDDPYEQFRSDLYEIAGQTAYDANLGGIGMSLNNPKETVQKFRDKLIAEGYDGILIKGTTYDRGSFNGENNQYVAFYPNQIKNTNNLNPTENEDIRFNIYAKAYDEYLKANNPNRSGVTIGDLKNLPSQQKLPTKQQKTTQPILPTTNVQATKKTQTISSTIEEPTLKVPVPKGKSGTEQKVAKVLSEPITKVKPEQRAWALFKANILDKGAVFEDLSFKSKNRELQAKWDSTLLADAKGQNAIGQARYEFENGEEKQVSKALTDIIDEVGENSEDFNNYMYHQLNIDRMTLEDRFDIANKPVFGDGIDANYSKQKVAELEKAHPEFKEYAQDVYDYLDTNKKELVDNGVISQETSDKFKEMYPHYVPIARIDAKGLAINVPLDTNRTGVNSPIKRAKGGSQDIQPLFQTIADRTMQTYKASSRNSFGLELKNTLDNLGMFNQLETTTENADNENLFEYDGEKGNLTEGTKYQNPTFTVFENGEKVTYEINQDMYDALRPKNEIFSKWDNTKLMKATRKINDFRRGILTEYNPAFSITNAIKDAQDVLMNSQHAGKTYAKFPEAYSQILKKGYWYKEYVQNGGSQNSYFTDGDFVKQDSKVKSIIKMPLEAISNINNVIEMSPRLAEYIASREQGKSIQSAMLDASRVTTNFKAGGDVTKFLNRNGATFLNASVQGLQQNIRNIREANAKGLKGYGILLGKAVIASLPALILNNLVWRDDDDYEELQDYVKDNYYIIAKIGDHKFLRIPKGRTVAVIQKAVTNMSDFITNKDEIDPDKYSEVIWGDLKDTFELASNNLAPNNPIENNIVSPIVQAVSNKTWYGEDLVPTRLQEKPNEEKYDESTAEISKQISGVLNKIGINSNPMQINYLLDQYGGGVSDVFLPMGTPQAENNMLEDKFTTDSVMKSRYPGEFFEQKDKLAVNRNSSKATDEDELLYKYANSVSGELSDLYQEKREIQNSSLTDKEKKKQIAEVQKQINSITEKALQDLKEPKIKDNTATIGNTEYIKTLNAKTGENEWKKLTDKTKIEGVSLKTQADYENRLAKYKQKTGDSQLSDKEETQIILDGNYTSQEKKAIYLSTTGKKDDLYKAVSNNMNIDEYLGYKTANIQGTKDSSGKTISGTKKTAQLDYINNNISGYENRLLLMGKDYKLSRSQQQDLSAYIDTLDNAEELYTMFDKNFTVKSSSSLGQYGKGNIDLYNRPIVTNSDGSISTVRSMSFEENGKEILIPTVVNGRVVSDDEAIDHYHRTGEYLGKFNSVKEADDYAEKLHEDQEKMYSSGGRTTGYTVYYK